MIRYRPAVSRAGAAFELALPSLPANVGAVSPRLPRRVPRGDVGMADCTTLVFAAACIAAALVLPADRIAADVSVERAADVLVERAAADEHADRTAARVRAAYTDGALRPADRLALAARSEWG